MYEKARERRLQAVCALRVAKCGKMGRIRYVVSEEVVVTMIASTSGLSGCEWAILEPLIPPAKPGRHPRSSDMRLILNGIFCVLRSGCASRLLSHDYRAWSSVCHHVRTWRNEGVCERMVTTLLLGSAGTAG